MFVTSSSSFSIPICEAVTFGLLVSYTSGQLPPNIHLCAEENIETRFVYRNEKSRVSYVLLDAMCCYMKRTPHSIVY